MAVAEAMVVAEAAMAVAVAVVVAEAAAAKVVSAADPAGSR
jgi:hypothetical protein